MARVVSDWRALDSGHHHGHGDHSEEGAVTFVSYRFHTSRNLPDPDELGHFATETHALSQRERDEFRRALEEFSDHSNLVFLEVA